MTKKSDGPTQAMLLDRVEQRMSSVIFSEAFPPVARAMIDLMRKRPDDWHELILCAIQVAEEANGAREYTGPWKAEEMAMVKGISRLANRDPDWALRVSRAVLLIGIGRKHYDSVLEQIYGVT